jgi:hypothetical protein
VARHRTEQVLHHSASRWCRPKVAVKGFDFQVLDPSELVPVLRALSGRLTRAAGPPASACAECPTAFAQAHGVSAGWDIARWLAWQPVTALTGG